MSDTVAACPDCETASVHMQSPGGYSNKGDTKRYRCSACGHTFDEYVERPRDPTANDTLFGLAERLDKASPDEVSR